MDSFSGIFVEIIVEMTVFSCVFLPLGVMGHESFSSASPSLAFIMFRIQTETIVRLSQMDFLLMMVKERKKERKKELFFSSLTRLHLEQFRFHLRH